MKASPLCAPARLPSKGAFLRLMPCGTRRARRGTRPHRTSSPGSSGFAAAGPGTAPFRRDDTALRLASAGASARPPFTSANRSMRALLWAGYSLSTSATSFQSTTHEHDSTSVVLARRRGLPCARCRARCAFALPAPSSLMQRRLELDAPQRATRVPRHPGSRPGPRRPESLRPRERHLSSGPAGHGKRADRKSGAKANDRSLAGAPDPRSLRPEVPSHWLLRAPPVTGDACETGWRPVRVLLHVRIVGLGLRSDCAPAKGRAIPKTEVLSTAGIEWRKGSLPGPPDRTSSLRDRDSGFAAKTPAPFLPKVHARG
jgi:hypothetical protein